MTAAPGKKKRRVIIKRPKLTAYQLAAFFHLLRYAWIEGTTKCGKTHTAIVWLHEQAAMGRFKNYWWVAPTYKAAKIAYTRMAAALPKWSRKLNETDLTITLLNGRIIWFLSGEKPDNLYGEDVGAVVIDEASRLREAAWHAIRSVVTFTKGPIRAIGNVKGKKNWFFKKCREAEEAMASGTPTNAYWAKITAADAVKAGILPQDEIDDARRELPEDVFNELYFGIPTEDGSNPFGIKHITNCAVLDAPTGRLTVARGFDVARAVDFTVNVGLDDAGAVSEFDRFQKPWEEFYKDAYVIVDKDGALTLVDSTGIGDVILSRLQRDRPRRFEGYKFSAESKQKLMEGLAVAIQKVEVKIPCTGPIRMELENFEFEYTRSGGVRYSAPEGFHDDCVMALALAVACRARRVVQEEGRVYMNWGDAHELVELPAYHAACFKAGTAKFVSAIVPSDRRAWIMTWFATFPNADVLAIAEAPAYLLHEARETPVQEVEDYRATVLAIEAALGAAIEDKARLADPDALGEGPGSNKALLAAPCATCTKTLPRAEVFAKCRHRLFYRAAIAPEPPNHALVRAAVGDPANGQRPKLYALKDYTPNFCFGMRHYAYHDEKNVEKGVGEKVQRRDRGPADTAAFVFQSRLHRPAAAAPPATIIPRRVR